MKKTKILILTIAATCLTAPIALAQSAPDGGKLDWNDDLQPFYKCMNESGWARQKNKYSGKTEAICISYPNNRGEKWKVVATSWTQGKGSRELIRLDIKKNGKSVFRDNKIHWANGIWQPDYACKGAPFGTEARLRSRDCFNELTQSKNQFGAPESRKNMFTMTGPRFNSIQRVWLAEGWAIHGPAHAQHGMTAKQDAGDCQALCIEDKACKAFAYAPGVCYLKPGGSSASYSPTVTSGRKW